MCAGVDAYNPYPCLKPVRRHLFNLKIEMNMKNATFLSFGIVLLVLATSCGSKGIDPDLLGDYQLKGHTLLSLVEKDHVLCAKGDGGIEPYKDLGADTYVQVSMPQDTMRIKRDPATNKVLGVELNVGMRKSIILEKANANGKAAAPEVLSKDDSSIVGTYTMDGKPYVSVVIDKGELYFQNGTNRSLMTKLGKDVYSELFFPDDTTRILRDSATQKVNGAVVNLIDSAGNRKGYATLIRTDAK